MQKENSNKTDKLVVLGNWGGTTRTESTEEKESPLHSLQEITSSHRQSLRNGKEIIILGAIGNTPRQNRDNMRVISGVGGVLRIEVSYSFGAANGN